MPDDQLAAVLEDRVRALRAGATREECLRAYPRLRSELAPLLQSAVALQAETPVTFPADAQRRARADVMTAIRAEPRERRQPFILPLSWRFAVPALAAVIAVVLVFAQTSPLHRFEPRQGAYRAHGPSG